MSKVMGRDRLRAARAALLAVPCLLAVASQARAVPTTSFVHTLSSSESSGSVWQSAVFEFGETVVIRPGDSMTLSVDFAGTQYLSFTDAGYESVAVVPHNVDFELDFTAGGTWTFTGLEGNLSQHPLGFRISNVPVLLVPSSFIEGGETARARGVDLSLEAALHQVSGSVSLDGFSLYMRAGDITIGGSATGVPEPGTLLLLGLALFGGLAHRRRA